MFTSDRVSVLGWVILLLIMSVPILNVIFVIWMFLRRKSSKTIKNFLVTFLVFYLLAFFGMQTGIFGGLSQLWG